ncbi:MAG: DUF6597 domain-containing transcriptional factor [Planctomycetota bacterium]
MTYLRREPPPALAPFVDHLWAFEDHAMAAPGGRLFADGGADLMWNLGPALRLEQGGAVSSWRGAWVAGPRTAPYDIALGSPRVTMVGVRLRPLGLASVLGAPAAEVVDRVQELSAHWRGDADEATARAGAASGPAARLQAVESVLLRRLAGARRPPAALARALDALRARPNAATVDGLAQALGLSAKHLGRLVRGHAGLGPKVLQRILRFRAVLAEVGTAPRRDWALLAAARGFSDQAHLCREFRAFAGLPPTRYRAPVLPLPEYVPQPQPRSDSDKTASAVPGS